MVPPEERFPGGLQLHVDGQEFCRQTTTLSESTLARRRKRHLPGNTQLIQTSAEKRRDTSHESVVYGVLYSNNGYWSILVFL